ncbi:MAG: hypothetical protein H6Q88_2595, partial [Anaeromyxobacteraceae bacterium]|nr:hypothetical protein [Anaeromyxobacteraceae bacterium]
TCEEYDYQFVETLQTTAVVVDDDGDPLDLSVVAAGGCLTAGAVAQPCAGAACDPLLTMCGVLAACGQWSPGGGLTVSAGDGVARVAGSIVVAGDCRP